MADFINRHWCVWIPLLLSESQVMLSERKTDAFGCLDGQSTGSKGGGEENVRGVRRERRCHT